MIASRNSLARFLASGTGRWLRIGAGLALISSGWRRGGSAGIFMAMVGLVPLSCGALDLCLLSFLFGGPLKGQEIREG